jgi:hypothetical protein
MPPFDVKCVYLEQLPCFFVGFRVLHETNILKASAKAPSRNKIDLVPTIN